MKQETILLIDIGNTSVCFGFFSEDKLVSRLDFNTIGQDRNEAKSKIEDFLAKQKNLVVKDAMIFSVVPNLNKKIVKFCKKFLSVTPKIFNWEKYEYSAKSPEITDKIGADLLADLFAATKEFKGDILVFDLGTVTKLLEVDKKGIFVGASFIPGMNVALGSFFKHTALLPDETMISKAKKETSSDTLESMKHGVYWQTVAYIEKQIALQKRKNIVLTGGNAVFVKDEFKNVVYDPDLTLKGMNLLYKEIVK